MIYDVELENTLNNVKQIVGSFETHHDPQREWILNDYPIKMLRGTEVETNNKKMIKLQVFKKYLLIHHIILQNQ